MFKLLNKNFDKIGVKKFKYLGPIVTFLTDVMIVKYINDTLLPRMLKDSSFSLALKLQNPGSRLAPADIDLYRNALQSTMGAVFWYMLLYHFIVYCCAAKGMRWGKKYIRFYTGSAALLTGIEIILTFNSYSYVNTTVIASGLTYGLVYLGYRHFMKTEEL